MAVKRHGWKEPVAHALINLAREVREVEAGKGLLHWGMPCAKVLGGWVDVQRRPYRGLDGVEREMLCLVSYLPTALDDALVRLRQWGETYLGCAKTLLQDWVGDFDKVTLGYGYDLQSEELFLEIIKPVKQSSGKNSKALRPPITNSWVHWRAILWHDRREYEQKREGGKYAV